MYYIRDTSRGSDRPTSKRLQ